MRARRRSGRAAAGIPRRRRHPPRRRRRRRLRLARATAVRRRRSSSGCFVAATAARRAALPGRRGGRSCWWAKDRERLQGAGRLAQGQYARGTVRTANADGLTYTIDYEDGESVDDAPHQFVLPPLKRKRDEGSSGEAGPSAAPAPAPAPASRPSRRRRGRRRRRPPIPPPPPPPVAAPAPVAPAPAPAPAPTGGGQRFSMQDLCELWHRQGHVKQDSRGEWSHLRKKLRDAAKAGRIAPHTSGQWTWGAGDRPLAEIRGGVPRPHRAADAARGRALNRTHEHGEND